ncbi:hypothetical protein QL995_13665 [Pseudoalteromonas sp. APC 3358]|uniref:hypothetical protein n=1 Tax=Pseudoalteromonas sp. APC 3358 TaxID=3035176 RepID=UPI0025B28DF1|nr:hypothetical protein [Pseudoalteromonas sp. APC 3358]MDN3383704.1 hypothetical protein [Pseudoalteromonas sp. APC 3358]
MKTLLPLLSLILQAFLLLALTSFFSGFYNAYTVFAGGDPKLMAGHISSAIVVSLIQIIPALIGLFINTYVLNSRLNKNININSSAMFINISKFYAYLWILFIPLGTFLGIKQLIRLKNVSK